MKKNRLTWGMGLMLLCGVIILALPWLMDRNNWDKDWDKPAVTPLWKANASARQWNEGFDGLAFSNDGKTLTSLGAKISRWNAETGEPEIAASTLKSRRGGVLSPDGKSVAFNRVPVRMRMVKVAEDTFYSKPLPDFPADRSSPVGSKRKFVNKGLYGNRGIDVFDTVSGRKIVTLPLQDDNTQYHYGDESRILFSPHSQRIITLRTRYKSFNDPSLIFQLWQLPSGRLLRSKVSQQRLDYVSDKTWSFGADNNSLYCINADHILSRDSINAENIIKPELNEEFNKKVIKLPIDYRVHTGSWKYPTLSKDGRYLTAFFQSGYYSGDDIVDKTISVWDLKKRQSVSWPQESHFAPKTVAFSPDSRLMAWAGVDLSNVVLNTHDKGKLLLISATDGTTSSLSEESAQDIWQQEQMARGSKFKKLLRFTPNTKGIFLPGDSGTISALAFSPDGTKLAAGYANGEIKMWNVPK